MPAPPPNTLSSTLLILCCRHADLIQTYNFTQHGGKRVPNASLLSSRPWHEPAACSRSLQKHHCRDFMLFLFPRTIPPILPHSEWQLPAPRRPHQSPRPSSCSAARLAQGFIPAAPARKTLHFQNRTTCYSRILECMRVPRCFLTAVLSARPLSIPRPPGLLQEVLPSHPLWDCAAPFCACLVHESIRAFLTFISKLSFHLKVGILACN